MYTKEFLKIIYIVSKVWHHLYCCPFQFKTIKPHLHLFIYESPRHIFIWRLNTSIGIIFRIIYFLICIPLYDYTHPEIPLKDRARFYILMCVSFMSIFLQSLMLFGHKRINGISNSFNLLTCKLEIFHGWDINERLGVEIYLKAILITILCVTGASLPRFALSVHRGTHIYGLLGSDNGIILSCMIAFFFTCLNFIDWMYVCYAIATVLFYVCSMGRSLTWLGWSPNLSIERKHQLLQMYRAQTIIHELAIGEFKHFLSLFVCIAIGIMISTLYTFIFLIGRSQHLNKLFAIISVAVFLITFIVTKLCMGFASTVARSSKEFSSTFLRNDRNLSKEIRLGIKSTRTLYVRIGNFTNITEGTFPSIILDIVLAKVIDLLLM